MFSKPTMMGCIGVFTTALLARIGWEVGGLLFVLLHKL